MPFHRFATIVTSVIAAAALTVMLAAALPGNAAALLLPLSLAGAALLHLLPRR
ncbi:hypothetical protein EV663_10518 [Rhodovulum bhavnagarense]|uniref:Uncharacterized protein n=1 Tax=Rhodovulum bhavnagarense TaxID=992286 RepID=A0A4R2RND6_9RHOB|nr:hypothetical protein [Rhodovulum bhavnagarense]TCP61301.1 hypothetical protein EV663_10518 [Rhodovulum bhavnagarense]